MNKDELTEMIAMLNRQTYTLIQREKKKPTGQDPKLCECGRAWNDCAARDGEKHGDRR